MSWLPSGGYSVLSDCRILDDDDACPVCEQLLAKLSSADECSLRGMLEDLEPEIKSALAFFCYRRAHLQIVGLAIAACCNESELISFGGNAGAVLFARSREECGSVPTVPTCSMRRKITLASGPMRLFPYYEEADDGPAQTASVN